MSKEYNEGYDARMSKSRASLTNPYDISSNYEKHEEWEMGWEDADAESDEGYQTTDKSEGDVN